MDRSGLAAALALFIVAAGCVSPSARDAPAPDLAMETAARLHNVAPIIPFEVETDNGLMLRGHADIPDGAGPFATVLELSPYWNTMYGPIEGMVTEVDGRKTLDLWLGRYLDAGRAVALVNMRGSGESDGRFQFGLPRDWADTSLVVEALVAASWSTGNVGMIDLSYPGWTQYMALAAKPPSLNAVIPVSGIIDPWNLWGRNGASYFAYGPAAYGLFTGSSTTGTLSAGLFVPDTRPDHFTCPQYGPDAAAHAIFTWNGDRTAFWDSQDLRPHIDGSTVPTLFTNGLVPGLGEGHILQFEGIWDLLAGDKRMMIGQWPHGRHEAYGREDFVNMTVAWMDHLLRGGPQRVAPGVVEYEDNGGGWHESDRWPPAGESVTLKLSDEALITDDAPTDVSSRTFVSSPADPAPDTCPGRNLVHISEPLANDIRLAGNFVVTLTLVSDLPDGNLAVFLYSTVTSGYARAGTTRPRGRGTVANSTRARSVAHSAIYAT